MPMAVSTQLFIDGKWTDGAAEKSLNVVNPATEEVLAKVPVATSRDVENAVAAARKAFDSGIWPRMHPSQRAEVMLRMAAEFERRRSELVELNIAETGATRALAGFLQVGTPITHFTDLAQRIVPAFNFEQALLPAQGGSSMTQGIVSREPYGVAALLTAFNFPFYLNLYKVGPALAAGCTMVLKPSPYTPLEALVIGEVAEAAELPPGVLNIVTGDVAAGKTMTRHRDVDVVSFTGSDAVGRKVFANGADTLKKVMLELGGKSANIILDDADLDVVVKSVLGGFVTHAGQGCGLFTRVLVHESLHDELVARIQKALARVKVGDPSDPSVHMGPLIREAQRERVESMIRSGLAQGAQLAYGGGRPAHLDRGYFVEPTLFVDVDNSMHIARKEIFGPVAAVIPVHDDQDAVRQANDSEFGLAANVWSNDASRALRIARELQVGTVTINGASGLNPDAPFGGYKNSGLGREKGQYGLSEFLQYKAINWRVGNS